MVRALVAKMAQQSPVGFIHVYPHLSRPGASASLALIGEHRLSPRHQKVELQVVQRQPQLDETEDQAFFCRFEVIPALAIAFQTQVRNGAIETTGPTVVAFFASQPVAHRMLALVATGKEPWLGHGQHAALGEESELALAIQTLDVLKEDGLLAGGALEDFHARAAYALFRDLSRDPRP